MSTAELSADTLGGATTPLPLGNNGSPRAFHRIKEVRRQQGCSVRRAAQMLKCDGEQVRYEEEETTDLPMSRLLQWQEVLEVPLAELLIETDAALSPPIMERARMIRLMKTALALEERAGTPQVKRMAMTLITQLKEIMPELEGVTPWASIGQRRQPRQGGRVYPDFDNRSDWRSR